MPSAPGAGASCASAKPEKARHSSKTSRNRAISVPCSFITSVHFTHRQARMFRIVGWRRRRSAPAAVEMFLKCLFALAPVGHVRGHLRFEFPAMIEDPQVNQFMADDVF